MCQHTFVVVEERERRNGVGAVVVEFVERCSACGMIKEGVKLKVDSDAKRS